MTMIIVLFGSSRALGAVASSAIIIAPSLCVFCWLLKEVAGEGLLYSQFASLIRTMYTAAATAAAEAHAFRNQY